MNNKKNTDELFTQQEVLQLLGLECNFSNRQKLTYLRLGRKQKLHNRNGRTEFIYNWKPQLILETDWCYQRGKVFYSETGIEKLKDILKNKKKIYIREFEL
jgi:hypothetical protein